MNQQHYNFQHHSYQRKVALKITQINLYQCHNINQNCMVSHVYPKMLFVYQGNGQITINHDTYPFTENDIFFINQGSNHYNLESSDGEMKFALVGFDDIEFFMSSGETMPYIHLSYKDSVIHGYLTNIIEELRLEDTQYQSCCNYLINLLFIHLQREYDLNYRVITKEKLNKDCEFIRHYLDEHYAENITLDILAKESRMNKYYLVHSFTNNYGCSPINYLNEKKIDESKILLETTNYSIADIAKMIGFSSQSYFSQSFKKHTYMTPNEYRQSTRRR